MTAEAARRSLDDAQRRALAAVLDELIPPSADGHFPGAGEAGLVDAIEEAMERSPDLRPAVEQGLAALEEVAAARGAECFAALERRDRLAVLRDLATEQPAFLPGLTFHTYVAYYQQARVVEALGLEARPPHPKGYELEPGDLGLLDDVRARPKLFREA